MLERLKFPWIYVVEVALWVLLVASFTTTVGFLGATPVGDLQLAGKSLPKDWEAALPSHGKYLEGYLVASHPVVFSVALIVMAAAAILLTYAYMIQRSQLKNSTGPQLALHKLAQVAVFLVIFLVNYVIVFHLLVGVAPT